MLTDQDKMQIGDPMKLRLEVLEMQKLNISTDRAQKIDKKNGTICLNIKFTPRAIVIKMSKMAQFCIFC